MEENTPKKEEPEFIGPLKPEYKKKQLKFVKCATCPVVTCIDHPDYKPI